MQPYNLYLTFLQTKRLLKIIKIVIKHSVIRVFRITRNTLYNSKRGIPNQGSTPRRLRMLIEELGPTFIKFGQILADRPDILPADYRDELRKLQSQSKPFKTKFAFDIIEHELGKKLEHLFKEIDELPFGSASIGQVYKATLVSGERVVVKVQRPNIYDTIRLDLRLMRIFAARFTRRNKQLSRLDLVGMVDSFSESLKFELDYRVEHNNIKIFRDMFRDSQTVHIPRPYSELCTAKVLVMEYIDGISPNDKVAIDKARVDRDLVLRSGAEAIFKMIMEYGIYHADPHPGNVLIMAGSKVAFLDFGMIGVLRRRESEFIAQFAMGYFKKDDLLITKSFLELCGERFFDQEDELRFDIRKMLLRNFDEPTLDIANFSSTLQECMNLVIKYQLCVPSDLFLLVKTTLTLEKFSELMDRDINLSKLLMPYAKKILQEKYSPRELLSRINRCLDNYIALFETAPRDIAEIIYKIKQGKIQHEINIEKSDKFLISIKKISLRISYVLILSGLFIGSSIMYVMDYGNLFVEIMLYGTLTMIVGLVIKWLFWR